LERIAVPRSQDLDSLLLDESKPVVPKKNSNNLRSGKQVSHQPSLPTFPWSLAFGSHSRTNSDIVKLSTSRSTCQGKWARIGLIASSTDISRGCFTNLDSFSYDQSLVPSTSSSSHKDCPSLFAILPFCHWNSSSSVTRPTDFEATTGTLFSSATWIFFTFCVVSNIFPPFVTWCYWIKHIISLFAHLSGYCCTLLFLGWISGKLFRTSIYVISLMK